MKHSYWLLLLLIACEHAKPDSQKVSFQAKPHHTEKQLVAAIKPTVAFTSGDRATNGPCDTLHVGQGIVLRLEPGSKSDFAKISRSQPSFSEARVIRQKGNGRVYRVGHTLIVRPFNGPPLRFSDDTYQMRGDENEDIDTRCIFSGNVPDRPYWIVDSLQYERYQPFLINKYSGRATLLSWDPEISPNRQFLLIATPGLDIESSLNGLELLTISDHEVSSLWTKTLNSWQPQQVRWLNNHTIAIEQLRFEPKVDTTYVRLLLPN